MRFTSAKAVAYGLLSFAIVVQVAVAAFFIADFAKGSETQAQTIREYNLDIVATDIDYGDGNIWHAWTFKNADDPTGAVPGPTLTVNAGEKLIVHVKNNLDNVHSFHSHLSGYDQESDGAQTNIISGVGPGAMIPPGGEWTYEFEPKQPGVYYYHCHSADGGLHIAQHIRQGLYGAIIVRDTDEKPIRDEVLFMSEMGHVTEGNNVPPFIMNGLGLPGGEHTLELAYLDGGFDAVAAQLGVTVPTFKAYVGEKLRLNTINIGDQQHTFHPHNVDMYSVGALGGRQWPANVVPLLPGAADQVTLEFEKPGLWLFHCHVVGHADAGMIGLFIIEEGQTLSIEPQGSGTGKVSIPTGPPPTGQSPPDDGTPVPGGSELHYALSEYAIEGPTSAIAGPVEFEATNHGTIQHELVVIKTDLDPAALPESGTTVDEAAAGEVVGTIADVLGGLTKSDTFTLEAGNYAIICNVAGHYRLGMYAPLVVQ